MLSDTVAKEYVTKYFPIDICEVRIEHSTWHLSEIECVKNNNT